MRGPIKAGGHYYAVVDGTPTAHSQTHKGTYNPKCSIDTFTSWYIVIQYRLTRVVL